MRKKTRRHWSTQQRTSIVEEYDAAPKGTKHAVLERHNVGVALVSTWRKNIEKTSRAAEPKATYTVGRSRQRQPDHEKREQILAAVDELRADGIPRAVESTAEKWKVTPSTIYGWMKEARERKAVKAEVDAANVALVQVNGNRSVRVPEMRTVASSPAGKIIQGVLRSLQAAGIDLRSLRVRNGALQVRYLVTEELSL